MARQPRTKKEPVNEELKNELLSIIFQEKFLVAEFDKNYFNKSWVADLEKHFSKPAPVVEPAKPSKNLKYKAMYERLSALAKKSAELVENYEKESKQETAIDNFLNKE